MRKSISFESKSISDWDLWFNMISITPFSISVIFSLAGMESRHKGLNKDFLLFDKMYVIHIKESVNFSGGSISCPTSLNLFSENGKNSMSARS